MKRLRLAAVVGAVFALIAGPVAYAAGIWFGLPLIGGASYCVGYSQYTTVPTVPGTQGASSSCNATAPAGPAAFTGYEGLPADLWAPPYASSNQVNTTPTSAYVSIVQLGQGPTKDYAGPATSQTIPANTPWVTISAGQPSAWTMTMPSNPIEGQIQHIVCTATTAGTLTVAASAAPSGNTLQGNPNTTCSASTDWAWRYVAASGTGGTWVRFH